MPANLKVVLGVISKGLENFDKVKNKTRDTDKEVNKLDKSLGYIASQALGFTAVTTSIALLARGALNAAMSVETFRMQLVSVSDSASDAEEALGAIREFARTSPLETEDVVKSYVQLRAVGIAPTINQMKTLGGVAVLFNRNLQDVSSGFIGMEKEVLRRLGIEIDRTGKKAIISSGNIRKEVNKDMESMRRAVIETWQERFPTAMKDASDTTKSNIAIMKSNFWELGATIGETFLEGYKSYIKDLGTIFEGLNHIFKNSKQDIENHFKWLDDRIKHTQKLVSEKQELELFIKDPMADTGKVRFLPDDATIKAEVEKAKARLEAIKKELKAGAALTKTTSNELPGGGQLGPTSDDAAAKEAAEKEKQALKDKLDAMKETDRAIQDMEDKRIQLIDDRLERELEQNRVYYERKIMSVIENEAAVNAYIQAAKLEEENIRKEARERQEEADKKSKEKLLKQEKDFAKKERQITMSRIELAQTTVNSMTSGLVALMGAITDNAKAIKAAAIIQAIADSGAAAIAAFKGGMQSGATIYDKLGLAFGAMSTSMTATATIIATMKKAALGRKFYTNGPAIVGDTMVGDNPGGVEEVTVRPVSSSNANGPMSGGGHTVNNYTINDPITGQKLIESMRRDGTMRSFAFEVGSILGVA